MQDGFGRFGGAEKARRLRANAARVTSTAKEIRDAIRNSGNLDVEIGFLNQVIEFFDKLNTKFDQQQALATKEKARAEAEWRRNRESAIAKAVEEIFSEPPKKEKAVLLGEALLTFASDDYAKGQAKQLGVDRWHFYVARVYELKNALLRLDAAAIARELAEAKLEAASHGRYWKDGDIDYYTAGWRDFEKFVEALSRAPA